MATPVAATVRLTAAVIGLAIAAALAALPAASVTIEIDDVASDRVERQRAFADGALPLKGTPDLGQLRARLEDKGLKFGGQLFIRIFKADSELEVWMRRGDAFVQFATYPICHWAGTIGPKLREGDKQNPEGFYSVGARQLHRIGRWPRSLNLGFPNAFDRAHGRTGSYILVHGGCSSVGCYAMTNAVMSEIFTLTEEALKAGQRQVDVHVFPFRMTDANLERFSSSPWAAFWRSLKEGYDAFEATKMPPRVGLCDKRYVVEQTGPGEVAAEGPLALCGALRAALTEPSSQSFAPLPRSWPLSPAPSDWPGPWSSTPMDNIPRSAYSGRPLSPSSDDPDLTALIRWQRSPLALRHSRSQSVVAVAVAAKSMCNPGLASCRKFLAIRSGSTQRRQLVAVAHGKVSRSTGERSARSSFSIPRPDPRHFAR